MVRGLYISASGMDSQLRNQEVVSNNLANVDTAGFKKDNLVVGNFEELLISRIDDPQDSGARPVLGSLSLGSQAAGVFTDFSEGAMTLTGRELDFAIEGDGLFALDTPQGTRYTRAGSFMLSGDGRLLTSEGYQVLGESGPMEVAEGEFYFSSQGELVVDGEIVNRLLVVDIPGEGLSKEGDSLFRPGEEVEVTPSLNFTVRQGFLESSNVNAVKEMVDMISGFRAYEINQRSLSMQDETLGRLLSEVLVT
ncbi:MAG: flagellar basal-body rod protein FlgF [Candidatus Omnitrophica bacterium]|nr:flagellar basal-body rod protein FlgF [Candidatus Omnitrophota bacterium]MBD3269668.1 flagellar basal-body rod protein FlgF [Candidatus Omnitrophota bacterium]